VRRSKAPFSLKTEEGRFLEEGRDFEPVVDPSMGTKPWAGCYDVYHQPPVIKMKGSWPDGMVLRVSYQHVATVYDGQAMIDLTEPETMALMRDQARRVHQAWHAKGYLMSFDEIRTLGWSPLRPPDLTPGKLIANAAKECSAILREVNPGGKIYTWSDMFDPNHNAVAGPYYLVNGPYTGSWDGLDSDVVVVNWNGGKKKQSLSFFDGRKNHQIVAGYYDGPLTDLTDWMTVAKKFGGVDAIMYTTWRGDYSQLEAFAAMVKQ
jgi:hypothetical protein